MGKRTYKIVKNVVEKLELSEVKRIFRDSLKKIQLYDL